MKVEYKSLDFEIKTEENGTFEGIAVAFDNIDLGNDRALKTIANGNINKKVPYLWQHNTNEPIGEIILTADQKGINLKGRLFLDTLENGSPAIPNAHKAYTLMKNGILKNSIGYIPLKYDFVTEGKKVVRNLKGIDIKEVSAVTFPMNPLANITDVKSEGGKNMQEKAMSFAEVLSLRKAKTDVWQLRDAFDLSIRQLLEDSQMKVDEKIAQLNENIDDFSTEYKKIMAIIINAQGKNQKSILNILETKSNTDKTDKSGQLEDLSEEELKKLKEKIDKLLEEEPEDETQEKTKNEKDVIMDIEVKGEDLEALQETLKNLKLEG